MVLINCGHLATELSYTATTTDKLAAKLIGLENFIFPPQ